MRITIPGIIIIMAAPPLNYYDIMYGVIPVVVESSSSTTTKHTHTHTMMMLEEEEERKRRRVNCWGKLENALSLSMMMMG